MKMTNPNIINVEYDDTNRVLLGYQLIGVQTLPPAGKIPEAGDEIFKNGKRCIVERVNESADSSGKSLITALVEI
jgi:hypothetical protein